MTATTDKPLSVYEKNYQQNLLKKYGISEVVSKEIILYGRTVNNGLMVKWFLNAVANFVNNHDVETADDTKQLLKTFHETYTLNFGKTAKVSADKKTIEVTSDIVNTAINERLTIIVGCIKKIIEKQLYKKHEEYETDVLKDLFNIEFEKLDLVCKLFDVDIIHVLKKIGFINDEYLKGYSKDDLLTLRTRVYGYMSITSMEILEEKQADK